VGYQQHSTLAQFFATGGSIRRLIARLCVEDAGQDIIEYGLLAAGIGLLGVVAWTNIRTRVGTVYVGLDSGIQGLSSCTPDPGGGGC